MPSLTSNDRVSLCLFTFTDGRRCRTPRTGNHPHFCFYHAQKEARSRATEELGKDLAYFFSGDYLSACDLSTALSRLIPAVVRGDIKPKLARTVAYLVQTLMQAVHISQHEYINAFGTDGWRKSVRTSVNGNRDYLFPPDPDAEDEPESEQQQLRTQQPMPSSSQTPSRPQQSAAPPPPLGATRPSPTDAEAALSVAHSIFSPRPNAAPAQIPAPTTNVDSHTPQQASSANQPSAPTCQSSVATPPAPPRPQPQPSTPNRDPYAVHFDHNYRLLIDGKPF